MTLVKLWVMVRLQGKPGTYCFPPKNCSVLRDTLMVLVREGHRQEEGALLCIISNVILMDWKTDRFRTVKTHWFFQALVGVDTFSFPCKQGTRIPNPTLERT